MKKIILSAAMLTAVFINAQNTGIGTTAPKAKLDVAGYGGMAVFGDKNLDPSADGQPALFLPFVNSGKFLTGWNRLAGEGEISLISNRGNGASLNGGGFGMYDLTADNVLNGILRVKGDGNVGIGTMDPKARLHIFSAKDISGTSSGYLNDILFDNYENTNDGLSLAFRRYRGSLTAPANLQLGDRLGGFNFNGYVNGQNTSLGVIGSLYSGNGITGNSQMYFSVSGNSYEKPAIFIDSNNNVGLNTAKPTAALDVNGAYGVVRGLGNELAYIGGDGADSDVQIGSQNPAIEKVSVFGASGFMDLKAKNITAVGTATIGVANDGAATDDILVRNPADGIVKKVSAASLSSASEPWRVFNQSTLTTTPATSNTQDIYQTGNVQIASSSDAQIGKYGNRLYFGGWDDQTDNMFITRYNENIDQSALRIILGNNAVNGENTLSTAGNRISDFFSVGAYGDAGLYEENFRLNSGTGEAVFGNQSIAEGTLSLRPNLTGQTSAKIVYSDAGNNTDLAIAKNVNGTEKDLMIVRENGDVNVKGNFLYVDGAGYEGNLQTVYIGADTANNDVEVGTLSPTVTSMALFNRGTGDFLNVGMRDGIIRHDLFVANNTNLQNVADGSATDDLLVRSSDGLVKKIAATSFLGSAQNLYNSNGALSDDRNITQNGHAVTFAGGDFNAAYSNFANGIIELTKNSNGDRNSFIDFHAAGAPGVGDFEARIIRTAGANGTFEISNTGTAPIKLWNVVNVTEKLGIGTDTPTARLHIIGSEAPVAQFETSIADAAIRIIPNHNMNGRFAIKSNDDNKDTEFLAFANGNAKTAIVIKHETGNVGIGQLNPQSLFEVAGTGGIVNLAGVNLDPNATGNISTLLGNYTNSSKMLVGWNRSGGDGEIDLISNRGGGSSSSNGGGFSFYDLTSANALNTLVRIKGDGNVGIGTAVPTQKLEVAGKIKAANVIFTGITEYADNAAAVAAGLQPGEMYRTGDVLKIAH